jgi:hypothetical protein
MGETLDAVFRYGLLYSTAPIEDRLLAILSGLGGLPSLSGVPAVALVSWVSICRRALRGGKRRTAGSDPYPSGGNDDRARAHELLSVHWSGCRLSFCLWRSQVAVTAITTPPGCLSSESCAPCMLATW